MGSKALFFNAESFLILVLLSGVLLENGAALSNSTTGHPESNSTDSISTGSSDTTSTTHQTSSNNGSSTSSSASMMTMMASTAVLHPFPESLSSETRAVLYTIGLLLGLACVVGCGIVGCHLYHRNDRRRRRQDRDLVSAGTISASNRTAISLPDSHESPSLPTPPHFVAQETGNGDLSISDSTTPTQASPTQVTPIQASPTQAMPTQASPTQVTPTQATPTQASPTNASLVHVVPGKGRERTGQHGSILSVPEETINASNKDSSGNKRFHVSLYT